MLRKKDKNNKLFYNFNLDDYVPKDHLLRLVNDCISFDFVRDRVSHLYSHTGQPAIDPVVLIKMLLIGYFYRIKSERQLEKEIQVNLAYRWFINYDIDEEIPDHSTISQTRKRKFKDSNIFQEIFDEIVRKCISLGYVKGETILTDSTHIKANASYKSLVEIVATPKEFFEQLDSNSYDNEDNTQQVDKNKKEKRFTNKTHRSKSDPDSRLMGRRGKPKGLHYLEHRSIDISGFITDVYITPSNKLDHEPYIDRIKRQKFAFKLPIKNAVADRGYGVGKVYKELTDMGIDAYISKKKAITSKRDDMFDQDDFVYNENEDFYICPNKKTLKRITSKPIKSWNKYSAGAKNCNSACPLRKKCTAMVYNAPRHFSRSIYQDYINYQVSKSGSVEWNRFMKIRKTLIEGSFADAKINHGLDRAKMRRIKNVQEQSLMTAIVQNIKKIVKQKGKNMKNLENKIFCLIKDVIFVTA